VLFKLADDLPALFDACFHSISIFKTYAKKVRMWTQLFAIALIAQSSDIMDYCPLCKDIKIPQHKRDLTPDGMPKFIVVKWKTWKGHPQWSKNQNPRYCVWLYANHKDL
jgi:hypothetical protein